MTTNNRTPTARGAAAPVVLALLAIASLLPGSEAAAQCVQAGSNVTCNGSDPNGFTATANDLTVTVSSGATVANGGVGAALSLLQNNQIAIESTALVSATGTSIPGVFGQASNTLVNRGVVSVSGPAATGVLLGDGSTLSNEATGTISVAPGILGGTVTGVRGASNGTISNAGLIQAFGFNSIAVQTQTATSVTNTGTISAPDDGAVGVTLGGVSRLDNSGTIEANGTGGFGVRLAGLGAQAINSGTIIGGSGSGAAVNLFTSGTTTNPNRFRNDATGSLSAASGLALVGSSGVDQVENRGTITGNVRMGNGADAFFWATDSTLTGTLNGEGGEDALVLFQSDPAAPVDETFDLGAATAFERLVVGNPGDGGSWTLGGDGAFATDTLVSTGSVRFATDASLTGPLTIAGGEVRLGDGTSYPSVSVLAGSATFESGASTQADLTATGGTVAVEGVSAIDGDLDLGSGAEYSLGFDSTSSDRLDVDGNVELRGGRLVLTNRDSTPLSQSGPFRILSASGGVTGEFGVSETAFTRATPSYGPTSGASFVDVLVKSTFTLPATSPNQLRVGQHLDLASQGTPSPDFAAFLDTLEGLDDASAGRQALDALNPELFDAHASASFETARTYAGLLAERPLRCEQLSSAYRRDRASLTPCGERGVTPWAAGFGRFADRSGDSNHRDWHYGGGGLAFGADWQVKPSITLSGLLGTSRVGLDFDEAGDGSLTTFELGVGAGWRHGGTHVRGALDYGHGWHDTHRQVDFPGFSRLALSDYDSDRVTVLVEAGHEFVWMPFEIEPIASLEYTFLHEQEISESNAGVADLDIDSRSNGLFATNAGVRAGMTLVKYSYAGPWLEWADGVWRPEIDASWRQVWNDYDRAFSSRLAGAPAGTPKFRSEAQDAQYGADLSAGVSFQPHGSRNTIALGYDAFIGNGTTVHSVLARVRIPF